MPDIRYVSPNGTNTKLTANPAAGSSIPLAWATIQFSLDEMITLPAGKKELRLVGGPGGTGWKENIQMKGAKYSDITIRGWTDHGAVTIQDHKDYDWGGFCEGRPPVDGATKASVFTIEDATGIVLQDVQIVNGKADLGAGVHATKSQVDLVKCCIHDNEATPHTGSGGGFALDQCNRGGLKSKIDGCVIFNNKAGKDGGGGWIKDNEGKVTVTATEFQDNGVEEDGGGLALIDCREIEILQHCLFGGGGHKNSGKNGGAIAVSANVRPITIGDPTATAAADKNKIEDNVATAAGGGIRIVKGRASVVVGGTDIKTNHATAGAKTADGGGIAIQQFELADRPDNQAVYDARLQLQQNTLIEQNTADRNGGGVFATLGSTIFMSDGNTVRKNSAHEGAGIHATIASNVFVTGQSEITDNTAEEIGGGLCLKNSWLELTAVTLDNNKAKYGGGAYVETRLPLAPAEKEFIRAAKISAAAPDCQILIQGDGSGNGSVSHNQATDDGGGLECSADKTRQLVMRLAVDKLSVAGNSAKNGGGFNLATVDLATILDSAFDGNTATAVGGAIRATDTRTVTVTKNTHGITDNKAQSGAGLALVGCNLSAGTVTDNIFQNNRLTGAGGAGPDALFEKCHLHPATLTAGDLENNNKDSSGKAPSFTIK